jgi:hypothetical protein
MTVNLENFKNALEAEDYESLKEILRLMPNGPWPKEVIHVDEGWSYYTEIKVKNWSPLVEAALAQDILAVGIIWRHFLDLRLFNLALQTIHECLQHKMNKQCDLSENTLKGAHSLLLTARERFFPQQFVYSKQEKNAILEELAVEINSINSVEILLEYYRRNVGKNYLNYRRHAIFDSVRSLLFCSEPAYTKSKAKFIELMQERGLELLRRMPRHSNEEGIASSAQIAQQLTLSDLFNPQHYKLGVEVKEPKEILGRFIRSENIIIVGDTSAASAPSLLSPSLSSTNDVEERGRTKQLC